MALATAGEEPGENRVSKRGFLADVLAGLAADPKTLPSKYFYDAAGSELFDAICEQEEYYPTCTEISILRTHANDMAKAIGADAMVVEYGAGSMEKIRILLDALVTPVAFVPVDISEAHLIASARDLSRAYPSLAVQQVVADFTKPVLLPVPPRPASRRVAFFPGSTIGNFDPDPTVAFLRSIGETVGSNGGLLTGNVLRSASRTRIALAFLRGLT